MILRLFSSSRILSDGRTVSDLHPVAVVFGDAWLDLSDAAFEEGTNDLLVGALFGRVRIWVPDHVGVRVDGLAAVGDLQVFDQDDNGLLISNTYESPNFQIARQRLNITAIAGFGSISVRRAALIPDSTPSLAAVA